MEYLHRGIELIKNYKIEAALLSVAFVITCVSLGLYVVEQKSSDVKPKVILEKPKTESPSIVIDIEGAVAHPGVYKLKQNARLVDALKSSGGLSEEADLLFFFRNFNQAGILSDQEKIYVPSQWEILSGVNTPTSTVDNKTVRSQSSEGLISINNASDAELEELPAVGKVTAEKISSNRPYATIEELLERNILGKSTYEKIKDLITVD